MALSRRAPNTSRPEYRTRRCGAFSNKILELVMQGLAGRAVGRERALGVARALAAEQDGRAARAVFGVKDFCLFDQTEKRLDRGSRRELGSKGLLDAVDLRRIEQRVAKAVDPGFQPPRLAAPVGHPPQLLPIARQQVEPAVEACFQVFNVGRG